MTGITIYEFDALTAADSGIGAAEGLHGIPARVYGWLEDQCLRAAEEGDAAWLRLTQRRGRRVVQVTSFVGSHHLVRHREQNWFRLKPDLLIRDSGREALVLDTKWKLLDGRKANGTDKYGLSQGDFYQLQAYGQSYLDGQGDVVLIYPKTAAFDQPLPVFEFPKTEGLRLWVLPFCLTSRRLAVPCDAPFAKAFADSGAAEAVNVALSAAG